MRLDRLWIENWKNLIDFTIDFDEKYLTTVLIGRNATGKSNLIEALVSIFRCLDLAEAPPFKYRLDYLCRGRKIKIDADPTRAGLSAKMQISVDGNPISFTLFAKEKSRQYLPKNIFGYYSGTCGRLEQLFRKHQDRFYTELLAGKEPPLRPLFYARNVHSQYVLLAFFSFVEEKPLSFLKEYFGIIDFENATFILKQPPWLQKKNKGEIFWGARGVVRGFLEHLYSLSLAPVRETVRVKLPMRRSRMEERLYLRIEDLDSLHKLASNYHNNVEFFKTLESTYISELIHELRIKVKKEGLRESLEFSELSEGEQQLLTVLGLLRFTQEEESLFLLDEPDTHLNPSWKLEYMNLLQEVVGENETSQVLIITHDPLLIGGLKKEQVQVFFFQGPKKHIIVHPPDEDPIGMGVTGLLTSDMFGLSTDLDFETQKDLDRKRELAVKDELTNEEKEELKHLDEKLSKMGFLSAFRDPNYSLFIRESMKYEQFRTPVLTQEDRDNQARLAREIVARLKKKEKE